MAYTQLKVKDVGLRSVEVTVACIVSVSVLPSKTCGSRRMNKVTGNCFFFFYQYSVTKCRMCEEGQGPHEPLLVWGHNSDVCSIAESYHGVQENDSSFFQVIIKKEIILLLNLK